MVRRFKLQKVTGRSDLSDLSDLSGAQGLKAIEQRKSQG